MTELQPPTIAFNPERAPARCVPVDLDQLIVSRLLVQANSGGGKSRALRYLLEQTHGKVQHIVIDREGEFATLRQRFPYILFGKDGDFAIDLRTAKLLARKLLETGTSAVLDLSEMALPQQRDYVRTFVDALCHLPRALWKDCLIVIDEAHLFAPESGKGSSAATEAIALLLSIGRKRGFCAVLATQRLAKLNKDVASECLNKLIGRTSNEDLRRAREELGQDKKTGGELRALSPGAFWAYGPAISSEPILVRTGSVQTAPPERGAARAPPATPEKIKAVLAEFADLPKEAADEAATLETLRREKEQWRAKALAAEALRPAPDPDYVRKQVGDAVHKALAAAKTEHGRAINKIRSHYLRIDAGVRDLAATLEASIDLETVSAGIVRPARDVELPPPPMRVPKEPAPPQQFEVLDYALNGELAAGERRMCEALVSRHPGTITKAQLATLAKMGNKGGTFARYYSSLKKRGLMLEDGRELKATPAALALIGKSSTLSDPWEMWRSSLGDGERRMLDTLREHGGLTRDSLGVYTELAPSGGTFNRYLGRLKKNGLVVEDDDDVLSLSALLR